MAARNSTRRKRSKPRKLAFPDFDAVLGEFAEALAVVRVSYAAISENLNSGPESITLRLGVEAFDRAYDRLDETINQLVKVRKAAGL